MKLGLKYCANENSLKILILAKCSRTATFLDWNINVRFTLDGFMV